MPEFDPVITAVVIVGLMGGVLGVVGYLTLAERKVSAWIQDRIGPNRVGPWGLLQPIVDGIKMFLKEEVIPKHVDRLFFMLAPALAAATALLAFAVVPFGPTQSPPTAIPLHEMSVSRAADQLNANVAAYNSEQSFVIAPGVDIGILWTFAIGSLAVYGVILGGWSANNKYALLGSLRSSAQIISYEIPLGMSILGAVLLVGSFNFETLIDWQRFNGWLVVYQPLGFLLFMTAVFAECNRLPFDLPEAEQELVGGYHTEYSSMKFGLFFLGEYTHMITTSFIMSVVFFGGWHMPFLTESVTGLLGVVVKIGVLAFKVGCFITFFMVVRWTIPRFRFDQLMSLAWQVMIPLSLMNLFCVMLLQEFHGADYWILTIVSVGLFASAALFSTQGAHKVRYKDVSKMKVGV